MNNVRSVGHVDKGRASLIAALELVSELGEERDLLLYERIRKGELRVVHSQRKRKLRKKGIRVWWEPAVQAYVWEPDIYWHNHDLWSEPK